MVENLEEALSKIQELERRVEDQQILIDALVGQIKGLTSRHSSTEGVEGSGRARDGGNSRDETRRDVIGNRLDKEVSEMFRSKKEARFSGGFTFEGFVGHARRHHRFTLGNRADVEMEKTLSSGVRQHLDKIVRHLVVNVNKYDLNTICSSFNLMSGEIEYQYKLVISHDIVLFIDDFSRMPFIIAALFNNKDIGGDTVGRTLRQILGHQYMVDREMYRRFPRLVSWYDEMASNFEIEAQGQSLESTCGRLIGDFEVFEDGRFNAGMFPNMYAMRMVSQYMDWDFTYNRFIQSNLYPKLQKSKRPLYAVYIFTLTFNALRTFGYVESVRVVMNKLCEMMGDSSELSAVIYLFMKQVDPERAGRWIRKYGESSQVDVSYLEEELVY